MIKLNIVDRYKIMETIELKENEILVLRTADKNGQSFNNFQWPSDGPVEAPDWNGKAECGGGLHGLPRGCGDGTLLDWSGESIGQLVAVNSTADYLEFDAKCKFKAGRVVFSKISGPREAIEILSVVYPDLSVVGRTATAGDAGTATAGNRGTATAGDAGTATAGDAGTATAGYDGTATAGYAGTATAGYAGTATAGDDGTATAGNRGTATAGDDGILVIKWYDRKRYRISIGYVGEDGIEPNKAYGLDKKGNFIAAKVEDKD